MLPVWKGCMFSLVQHFCERLSQLSGAQVCFVCPSETKPLTNNFSPFPLFQIVFLFCIWLFYFFLCQNFSLNFLLNRKLPLPPFLHWVRYRAMEGSQHSSFLQSTGFPPLAEGMLPCPGCSICYDPPLPKAWDIPGWGSFPQKPVRCCGVSQ